MAEKVFSLPSNGVEPLRANRWILHLGKIPSYLVRNVTLETITEKVGRKSEIYTKLNFSLYNIVDYTIVPDDVIQLKKIKLEFLDPTGVVVNGYDMNVSFEKMSLKCDYGDGGLLIHEFIFYVKNLNQLNVNIGEESEKEIIENYKKKKEKES